MTDESQPTDPIDRLVVRYLRSEQDRVDGEAFLQRLKEKRRRGRQIVRFPVRLAAVAVALLLVAAGALALLLRAPEAETPGDTDGDLLALERCSQVIQGELRAALEGVRGVGSAAVSAGRAPLDELARGRIPVPRLPESAEAALRRFVPPEHKHLPSEEDER